MTREPQVAKALATSARAGCPICGASLDGLRADARYCCTAHRVEGYRLRTLAAGRAVGRYRTLAQRMAAYGQTGRHSRNTVRDSTGKSRGPAVEMARPNKKPPRG